MLSLTGSLRVFLAVEPVDLRKSFNGLHTVVLDQLGEEPSSGALFVFTNRRRTLIKTLYWDGMGVSQSRGRCAVRMVRQSGP